MFSPLLFQDCGKLSTGTTSDSLMWYAESQPQTVELVDLRTSGAYLLFAVESTCTGKLMLHHPGVLLEPYMQHASA